MARRTRKHVIADLAVNFVERQILLAGYTAERQVHDYGIDLMVTTFSSEGETESGSISIQVKATDHLTTVGDSQFIPCRIWCSHARRWLLEPMPVILVVYDATLDAAYWLHVQGFFSPASRFRIGREGQMTLHIPRSQRLTDASASIFRQLKIDVLRQFTGRI